MAASKDQGVVVGLLRLLRGWEQSSMAAAAGLSQACLSRYEAGRRSADLERLALAAMVPSWVVEGVLVPIVALSRVLAESLAGSHAARDELLVSALAQAESVAERIGIAELLSRKRAEPLSRKVEGPRTLVSPPRTAKARLSDRLTPGGRRAAKGRGEVAPTAGEVKILVGLFGLLRGGTDADLAAAAGLHPGTISRYRHGVARPDRFEFERLVAAVGLPMWAVEDVLLPALALALASETALGGGGGFERLTKAALAREQRLLVRKGIEEFVAGLTLKSCTGQPARAMERETEVVGLTTKRGVPSTAACQEFVRNTEQLGVEEQRDLVERTPEFQSWVMAEVLCAESVRAAADDAARAYNLAMLALRVAELAPGDLAWRFRLQGYTWAFVGNAQRVGNNFAEALTSFERAWRLWRDGGAAKDFPLFEWRLLDLEASMQRELRRFTQAMELLDRALKIAPRNARGRILLNKQVVLEEAGEPEAALAILEEATAALIDMNEEPRLKLTLRMSRLVLLCQLGRFGEAEDGLPALLDLTAVLGMRLDLARVEWLRGRVAAGLGRTDEAYALLEDAQRIFANSSYDYDAALVSLELTALDLLEGRTAVAAGRAQAMMQIFRSRGVGRETLAALSLFRRAAQSGSASADAARRLLGRLEREQRTRMRPRRP